MTVFGIYATYEQWFVLSVCAGFLTGPLLFALMYWRYK